MNQSRSTLRAEHGGSEHPRANPEQELTQIRSTLFLQEEPKQECTERRGTVTVKTQELTKAGAH